MMATKPISSEFYKLNQQKHLEKSVSFEHYAPFAKQVSVAGQFNEWDASHGIMKKDHEGVWKGLLHLAPGRYEYRFWVDGNWENDPKAAEYVPNSFGTWNCVVEVN